MFSEKLKAAASPVIFLISSLGITFTGPNALVVAGGIGLSLAAIACLAASQIDGFGAKYGRLIPFFALCANVPLTINGIFMIQGGMASGQTGLAIAGVCLALANSVFYGSANVRGLFNRIAANGHAFFSMGAGTLIAFSGVALFDPVLTILGCGYITEAALRRTIASPVTQEASSEIVKEDLRPG